MDREVAVKEPGTGTILLDVTPGPGEEFERSMFESAHGVVFELDLDRPEHRAIVVRYRALRVLTSPSGW